jgi:Tfp pilus assembly protein PilO
MNAFLDRLNLRPQERRLVVGVLVVVFVVVNLWFVWPHASDLKIASEALKKSQEQLLLMQRETDPKKIAEYQAKLTELEGEGSAVLPAEQGNDMAMAIARQANQCGVAVPNNTGIDIVNTASTNSFFEEKSRRISVVCGEKELVNFLISLGSSNSMIRVRSMKLNPDNSQIRLQGEITLVASYLKPRPTNFVAAAKPQIKPAAPKTDVKQTAVKPDAKPPTVKPAAMPDPKAPTAKPDPKAPATKPDPKKLPTPKPLEPAKKS